MRREKDGVESRLVGQPLLWILGLILATIGVWLLLDKHGAGPARVAGDHSGGGTVGSEILTSQLDAQERAQAERIGVEPADRTGLTVVRVFGMPGREPLAHPTCRILGPDQAPIELTAGPDGSLECASSSLANRRLELGAEDYVTIGFVVPRRVPDTLEFELQLSGTLDVSVVGEKDRPIPGAVITVYPRDLSVTHAVRVKIPELWKDTLRSSPPSVTNEVGQFRLEGYPCDTPLVVGASGVVPGVVDTVVIPSSARRASVTIHADLDGCIRGQLVGPDGSPVTTGLNVLALDQANPHVPTPHARSDPEGRFTLCGLPRGRVTWYIDSIGERTRFTAVDSEIVDVGIIRLRARVPLTGRVFLENPPPGCSYRGLALRLFQDGDCAGRFRNIDEDGSFRAQVPAGRLIIQIEAPSGMLCAVEVETPCPPVEIRLDPYVSSLWIRKASVGKDDRFSVSLLESEESSERPLRLGRLQAMYHNAPDLISPVVWGTEGDMGLLFLRPDSYQVCLLPPVGPASFFGSVTLEAGRASFLECPDTSPGRIEGRVVDLKGSPIGGASVTAKPDGDSASFLDSMRSTTASEDGTFSFEGLPGGPWVLYPESLGPRCTSAQVLRVEPGKTRSVELVVERPGRLTGLVTEGGLPVEGATLGARFEGNSGLNLGPKKTETSSDGRYRFDPIYPGHYELVVVTKDRRRVVSRKLTIEDSGDTVVDVDLEAGVSPVVFVRDGRVLDSIDRGTMTTQSMDAYLQPWPGRPGVWAANLDGGPALALLQSGEISTLIDPKPAEMYWMAYRFEGATPGESVEFELRGPTLSVRPRDSGVVLPWAYVRGVGEFADRWKRGRGVCLAYEDVEGVRRFRDIPEGTALSLMSPSPNSKEFWSQDILVESSSDLEVEWPPKD